MSNQHTGPSSTPHHEGQFIEVSRSQSDDQVIAIKVPAMEKFVVVNRAIDGNPTTPDLTDERPTTVSETTISTSTSTTIPRPSTSTVPTTQPRQ